MTTVQLEVLLFAAAREAVGRARVPLTVPLSSAGTTTATTLLATLIAAYPTLAAVAAASVLAINRAYVPDPNAPLLLQPHDEVALIPPVSGG
jgi:molybdopterin converting factor small subunit